MTQPKIKDYQLSSNITGTKSGNLWRFKKLKLKKEVLNDDQGNVANTNTLHLLRDKFVKSFVTIKF